MHANAPSEFNASHIAHAITEQLRGNLRVIEYTVNNDPNGLLGKERGYTSAANIEEFELRHNDVGINRGPVVEVFPSEEDARVRFDLMTNLFAQAGPKAQTTCVAGPIVLRFPPRFAAYRIANFVEAFSASIEPYGFTIVRSDEIDSDTPDNPGSPKHQAAAIEAVRIEHPTLTGLSDDEIRSILITICELQSRSLEPQDLVEELLRIQDNLAQAPHFIQISPYEIGRIIGTAAVHMCPRAGGWVLSHLPEE